MTPIISPWVFYAISVVDGLKVTMAVGIALAIATVIVVSILAYYEFDFQAEVTDRCKKLIKIAKRSAAILAVFITFFVFTPDSNTIIKMIIAQNVTYERVDTVQEVYEDFMELFEKEIK